jgi:hypothetical protein
VNDAATGEFGDELDVGQRRRKDASANGEDFAAHANRFSKISSNMCESREEEISEIVADKPASGMKAVLKQSAKKSFIFRKRNHAIADVAWWKNSILTAKTARAAAIIGNSNNRRQFCYGPQRIGMLVTAADDILLEPTEKSGKSGSPAESYDAESAREAFRFERFFLHRMT